MFPLWQNLTIFNKSINDTGFISNYQLGQLIDSYYSGADTLDTLNDFVFCSGIGTPAGFLNSIVSRYFAGGPTDETLGAYFAGKDVYWVSVYASGVKPSLSTEGQVVFSDTTIRFTDDYGWRGL
ncbi:hypothetical protein [Sediminibacillus sp. JSM 1682029]|uniref:hypothetical protein n=1 Tax=Sediminibacillus sp. JSM 1682029 TaxID=3229857 RepID=UPI003523E49F